ncbi:hypothetical protein LCL99_19900 [Halomonas denitrificans]|uniref:hypothetical protein n=1 Tax=Halomonas denitrificans TaxID=370769 RepID=UPI001CD4F3E6|nr:hypothetical protein [Halomonas denitrificans]MCA0976737.1 hypothetical protein [Halomonas denitrificans]
MEKKVVKIFLHCIFSLILLFYLYNVKYSFLPIDSAKVVWLVFVLLFVFEFCRSRKFRYIFTGCVREIYPVVLLLVFGVTLLALTLLNAGSNLTIPYYSVIYVIDVLPVVTLLVYFFCFKLGCDAIKAVVLAGMIQGFLIFIMLVSEPLKDLYQTFVITGDNILSYYDYRRVGITGFANYTVGIVQAAIACLQATVLMVKLRTNREKVRAVDLIVFLILIISALLSSRSSLIIFGLFVLVMVVRKAREKSYWLNIFPLLSTILTIGATSILLLITNEELIGSNVVLRWSLEPFINLFNTGLFTTGSSDTIMSFYFDPGLSTLIFGDWQYVNDDGTYYRHVDAGYMRMMLFMGLPLSLVYYSLILWILTRLYKLTKKYEMDVFLITIVISLFILHYKGNIFIDGIAVMKIVFLVVLQFFIYKRLLKYNYCRNIWSRDLATH